MALHGKEKPERVVLRIRDFEETEWFESPATWFQFLGSPVVPFCLFSFWVPLLKPNSRKKGTLIFKGSLENLDFICFFARVPSGIHSIIVYRVPLRGSTRDLYGFRVY